MTLSRRHFLHESMALGAAGLLSPGAGAIEGNPFLEGNFAPVREEVVAEGLPVQGKLPADLEGMFVRNGPNPQFSPPGRYHWFDGDGMLHGVRLQGGKASYRNRYIQTEGWKAERKEGKAVWGGLLDAPDFKRLLSGMPFKNTANTALVWHHGKLLALWEAGSPHIIDVPDLATRGMDTLGGKWRHPFTAHPKVDPSTGEMIFFGYSAMQPTISYGVTDAAGTVVHATTIALPRAVMMHDFAITATRTLLLDLPVTFDIQAAAKGGQVLVYNPTHGARLGVLPRRGLGESVRWFPIAPGYVFHTLNAYDDGDAVVLYACRMKRLPDVLSGGPAKGGLQDDSGTLYRWRVDLTTGKVDEGPVDDVPCDFPRVHEGYLGRRLSFGYAAEAGNDLFSGLLKYDMSSGKKVRHSFGAGRSGGEGVFVPRPGGKSEDEGWLLTLIHDRATNRGELLIVDAQAFSSEPVARVMLPGRVPYGFHGAWVPGDALKA